MQGRAEVCSNKGCKEVDLSRYANVSEVLSSTSSSLDGQDIGLAGPKMVPNG